MDSNAEIEAAVDRRAKRPAADPLSGPRKRRTRQIVACDTCRTRKTKCDGRRPKCSFCITNEAECVYKEVPESQAAKLEHDISSIKNQLQNITNILSQPGRTVRTTPQKPSSRPQDGLRDAFFTEYARQNSAYDFPFLDLKTELTMTMFNVRVDLSRTLARIERANYPRSVTGSSHVLMMQHQKALNALSLFSSEIHIWYPILPSDYSERYMRQISGNLSPSTDTCLALLICAIGTLLENMSTDSMSADVPFFDLAMTSLPIVLFEHSVTSVQCLILLSLYHNCLLRPCQAHDDIMIASFKIQSLLRNWSPDESSASLESARRAFWAILLIENELNVQFALPDSGLWDLDSDTPLPSSQKSWHFNASTPATVSTPGSMPSPESATHPELNMDKMQSYFLAAIAMRRMLHRCTTAIRPNGTRSGKMAFSFAPVIARELETQLDEWYNYLPRLVRFDKENNMDNTPGDLQSLHSFADEPLSDFLKIQYSCCRASIYWPAVRQSVECGEADADLLANCQKFFNAYTHIMSNMERILRRCKVNTWTLYATIFILTLAAIKGVQTPCLYPAISHAVSETILSVPSMFNAVKYRSQTLAALHEILEGRVVEFSVHASPATANYARTA